MHTKKHTNTNQQHTTTTMMDIQITNRHTTETTKNTKTRKSTATAPGLESTNTGLNPILINHQQDKTQMIKQAPWGHPLEPKETNRIRIVLQNIGGIDMTESGSIKLAALRSFLQEAQVDACALTECNVAWNKAPAHLYLAEQTRYWWEASQWSLAHNIQETNKVAYQPGGTGLLITNQLTHQAQRRGDNKIGLGRWCWARLRGKHNKILQLVAAY